MLDGAVRKHRLFPCLSGSQGMSSFIADETQKTWEVFSSGTADRSAENKGAFQHTESDTVSQSLGRSAKTLGAGWC